MGLSYLEIQKVLADFASLPGALLQEVYQPAATELVLELRIARESHLLVLSTHPRLSRLHLIAQRPPNPLKPFPFQMLCRKELNGRLIALDQPGLDRAVHLTFQGAQRRTLVAELMDRHGNLFLLDEAGLLLGTLLPGRSDSRHLLIGQPYRPLEPSARPARVLDRFQPGPGQNLQVILETFFALEHTRLLRDDLRGRLRANLRRELKRLERRRIDLEGDLGRAEKAEQHRRFGDLLQIHLRDIPRGRAHVTVPDSFATDDEALVEIPLDPQLDAVANLQRHYRLYRKYDASIPMVLERLEETEREMTRLAEIDARLDTTEDLELLQALEKEAHVPTKVSAPSAGSQKNVERSAFFRYATPSGTEIWVGRSASDNDVLTFREARGNDFWLHIRGRPGAHVVIPARGTTPDLETLLDAAGLALRHSGISPGDRADVAYTRCKYVRKLPGAHPGMVTFTQDKTLFVELDPVRLGRLTRLD